MEFLDITIKIIIAILLINRWLFVHTKQAENFSESQFHLIQEYSKYKLAGFFLKIISIQYIVWSIALIVSIFLFKDMDGISIIALVLLLILDTLIDFQKGSKKRYISNIVLSVLLILCIFI